MSMEALKLVLVFSLDLELHWGVTVEGRSFGRDPHVLYDLKHLLPRDAADLRL